GTSGPFRERGPGTPGTPPGGRAGSSAAAPEARRRCSPRSCPAGSRRSRSQRPPPQELGVEAADLPPEDPAGVEEVVADRRFAAAQDLGDLGGLASLHLLQDEHRFLPFRQTSGNRLEEPRELRVLGRARRVGGSGLLALLHEMEGRTVGPLAAASAAEEVDREIRRDAIEPGVQRVALVIPVELAPDPEEDHLA